MGVLYLTLGPGLKHLDKFLIFEGGGKHSLYPDDAQLPRTVSVLDTNWETH